MNGGKKAKNKPAYPLIPYVLGMLALVLVILLLSYLAHSRTNNNSVQNGGDLYGYWVSNVDYQ